MNERRTDSILSVLDATERDSLSTRIEFEGIISVLKARFSDYSDDAPVLATLSPALELETLRLIFNLACRASSFNAFCEELGAFWASRDP